MYVQYWQEREPTFFAWDLPKLGPALRFPRTHEGGHSGGSAPSISSARTIKLGHAGKSIPSSYGFLEHSSLCPFPGEN